MVALNDGERTRPMHCALMALTAIVMLATVISGCSRHVEADEHQDSDALASSGGEHDRDGEPGHDEGGEEEHREEGEEDGAEYGLNDTYDQVRNGVRLIMAYDREDSSFNGTVENTTDKTLQRVRVEVHLSNGKELGPTTATDLDPGEMRDVVLAATGKDFDGWTAHPEVGSGEH